MDGLTLKKTAVQRLWVECARRDLVHDAAFGLQGWGGIAGVELTMQSHQGQPFSAAYAGHDCSTNWGISIGLDMRFVL